MPKNNYNGRGGADREKQLHSILRKNRYRVHFIGIGGVSMYSLALLSKNMGADVSGSDSAVSARVRRLSDAGINVFSGHSAENIGEAELVVYSHAISEVNPELREAQGRGLLCVSRAEFMGALMLSYRTRIGVSGSHGKSTTTAILEHIFTYAGADPTVLSGSELESGEPYREGGSATLIYEACEYRDSFLSFSPSIAVALNLELDHTDYFENIASLRASFTKALARATSFALVRGDDQNLAKILPEVRKKTRLVTFGENVGCDYSYFINCFRDGGFDFTLSHFGVDIKYKLDLLGVHNVSNAVAAVIVALESGISPEITVAALESFRGISRRLEYIGDRHGKPIYYDYAHHPTEIAANITALKLAVKEPLTVVFKPHTFSRTASLWEDFCSALSLADKVIVTDIYPAREAPIEGINARRLAEAIGSSAEYSPDSEVYARLDEQSHRCAVVLMGAGDMEDIKYEVLNK